VLAFTDARGAVEVVFTDRHGGAGASGGAGPSGGAGASGGARPGVGDALDLAEPPLDSPDLESRLALLEENIDVLGHAVARGAEPTGDNPFELAAGTPLPAVVRMRQVHGNHVHLVDRAWLEGSRLRAEDVPAGATVELVAARSLVEADGLVTDVPGVALLVRVADCVPVLLADPERAVVGAAHAGRNGLVAGVVPATLARMRALGAERVVAWVGPSICGRCYEVPVELQREVVASVPEAAAETAWGTPAVDVGAGVVAQLRAEGVEVVDASRCTREDEELWSYRRDGAAAGRLGGLVWVRP
jgi:YfiH family protein